MRKGIALLAALAVAAWLTACGTAENSNETAANYPSDDLDWTVAFGPGGGNDIMARTMVDIINEKGLYPGGKIVVQNREGGSGATGWGYLSRQEGSGYAISTTSGSFITTPLQANTGWTPKDFTPVGLFATDDTLFIVPGTSPITSWQQWVDFAKRKGTVAVGGIGTVNVDFIIHAILADTAGYQIDYVPFNEEGQMQTALLSGALDGMVSNPGSILGQVKANAVRPLLFSGKQPLPALPEVPTGESLGFAGLPSMPRGLILPPEAPQFAQEWWINTMKAVVATPEWQEYLKSNYLTEDLRWGADFGTFLTTTSDEFRRILTEKGVL
ncbi:Bug family tripartite tricarboxylate transporter substrate binding protein [Saccharopolyspora sp. 5N708]|uniref:Bug family tripartite tricarboxylate transporter substrate binding protein n=1 Tax=Saccharopolyspora sp. 5N708 TaxID=3457424 RepID=UPI003FD0AFD2